MNVFSDYARYYDLLYKDKDYAAETAFVFDRLRNGETSPSSLLELGCGTGRHAVEFAKYGLNLAGIDISAEMVTLANEYSVQQHAEGLHFEVGDVRLWRASRKFDAVISLFHVISYQTSNEDLRAIIKTAAVHLDTDGLFFFDFWYGPAVLSDPPVVRVKRMEDDVIKVTRIAEPVSDYCNNIVTVNYEIAVANRQTGSTATIQESHHMRYLFMPELAGLLNMEGFSLVDSGPWMSLEKITEKSWYGWALCKKR